MEEEFFYIRPTNSILLEQDSQAIKISINDICKLAEISVSLTPQEEFIDTTKHINCLNDFFKNNEIELKEVYNKLTTSHFGVTFLLTLIKIMIIEKKFRDEGIDEYKATLYNMTLVELQGQLEMNKIMFESERTLLNK